MAWKCSRCGTENDDTAKSCHGMCGNVRFGRLVLTSATTGQELRMNIDTAVGKALIKKLIGDEARYASEPQFYVKRCETRAAWVVEHFGGAKNKTHVDGNPLDSEGVKIEKECLISIGKDKAALKVRIEF